MIERKFVAERLKEFKIQEYISETLHNVGHSHTKLVRTPLGEKIIIHASRPGLIVGRKGENIKKLTATLKRKFKLDNPQIEISEVENPSIDAQIVAERIASTLERFGSQRFKAVAHKTMQDVIDNDGTGIEIIISGKVPSSRARSWRFYRGYLKKCGSISIDGVRKAISTAKLKTGIIGIKVSILPKSVRLPDDIQLVKEPITVVEQITPETVATPETKKAKKTTKRKTTKKKAKTTKETTGTPIEQPSIQQEKTPEEATLQQ